MPYASDHGFSIEGQLPGASTEEEKDMEEGARREEARTVRRETLADLGDDLLAALESLAIAYGHDATTMRDGGPIPTELVNARAVLGKAQGLGLLPIPPRPADPPPGAMRLHKRAESGWGEDSEVVADDGLIAKIAAWNGGMTPDQVRAALAAGQRVYTNFSSFVMLPPADDSGAAP